MLEFKMDNHMVSTTAELTEIIMTRLQPTVTVRIPIEQTITHAKFVEIVLRFTKMENDLLRTISEVQKGAKEDMDSL